MSCRHILSGINIQCLFISSPVASAPTITSLEQTSSTTVRVEWRQPPGGAEVTGYVVYYINGGSIRSRVEPSSSTSTTISGLTIGRNYTISVEALPQHLYGVSEKRTITISEENMFTYDHYSMR